MVCVALLLYQLCSMQVCVRLIQNRSDERILKSALVGIHDKTVNTERHECKFELSWWC